ncbi:unnamed protein product [Paramecium sonneborni]|uniref:Nematode cuticle collagen N-terminal domain-containing protein n=1 Tax=Paramecium sonneborni TaxID=65129 RepID=A0A8S1RPF6_9CILI|nr:unnamed protein product [Paramecium sonneborni]
MEVVTFQKEHQSNSFGISTYSNRMNYINQQKEKGEEELIHDERSAISNSLETLAKFLVFIGCTSALTIFIVLELYMDRELNELQQQISHNLYSKSIIRFYR